MPQHTEDETADLNREQLKMFQTRIKPGKKHRQQQVTEMKKNVAKQKGKEGRNSSSRRLGSIQKAGLQSLIGKISKRARQTSRLVAAAGKTPNFNNLGKAVASIGSISANANGKALGGLGTNKLGIGTMGKGGGNTGYLGSGNLKSDGVGVGNVGLLEEESEIYGGLDREVIAEYIRSKLGEILYCYERQLSANPDLFGKVEVKFTIGGTGLVGTRNIGATSLKNQRVENCILQKISAWKFPSPKGGTQVRVTYPFLFKSMN